MGYRPVAGECPNGPRWVGGNVMADASETYSRVCSPEASTCSLGWLSLAWWNVKQLPSEVLVSSHFVFSPIVNSRFLHFIQEVACRDLKCIFTVAKGASI